MNVPITNHRSANRKHGFTLLELVVVCAILALLATAMLPALARTQPNSKAVQCQNNLKRLTTAWTMYASDFKDVLPLNSFTASAPGGADTTGWITGWLDWATSPDNTNTALIAQERYAKLAPYFNSNPKLFKCPADLYKSQANLGPRVRSISMNISVGQGSGKATFYTDLYLAATMSQFVNPGPSASWVLADEQADSINDGILMNNPNAAPASYSWLDLPASYHNGGCSFSFADGHTEVKNWQDPRTKAPVGLLVYNPIACPGGADYAWLIGHTPRKP